MNELMREVSRLCLCLMAGVLFHQSNPFFLRLQRAGLPPVLDRLGRYIVGALLIRVGDQIFWRPSRSRRDELGDDALVLIGAGLGVAMGYLLDDVLGEDSE